MFSCEFYEISKNTIFTEHLWTTAFKENIISQCLKENLVHDHSNRYSRKLTKDGEPNSISQEIDTCLTLKVTPQIIYHWKALFFLSKNLWVVKTDIWSVIFDWTICSTHTLSFFSGFLIRYHEVY